MIYIGIPTVNNLRFLQETVASIKTEEEYILHIINNGSTDDTRDWLDLVYEDTLGYPNRRFAYENYSYNNGVSRSWNKIINAATSYPEIELIYILNNDIVLGSETLDSMLDAVRNHGRDGVSGINLGSDPKMLGAFEKPSFRWSTSFHFSCFALTPRLIKRVGLFDENFKVAYFEDNDYHHRMNQEEVMAHCDMWAPFAHYGSRSIKEGGVKHEPFFSQNREYFKNKWGFSPDRQ